MSLKFLAKKSWHTTNLSNVEKVWIAEQNAEKEKKKLTELQKQINEERQIQELRELQVASGQVVKTVDTTLDWMYEGPAARSEQSTEEYLLGKIYKPKEEQASELKEIGQKPGSLWMNKVSSKNDTFTRLHEDPMLIMKKSEKEARENVINNPVKMARIRHQLAAEVEAKKAAKRERKEQKREKKEKDKKKRRERSSSSSSRGKDRCWPSGSSHYSASDDRRGYAGSGESERYNEKKRRRRSRSGSVDRGQNGHGHARDDRRARDDSRGMDIKSRYRRSRSREKNDDGRTELSSRNRDDMHRREYREEGRGDRIDSGVQRGSDDRRVDRKRPSDGDVSGVDKRDHSGDRRGGSKGSPNRHTTIAAPTSASSHCLGEKGGHARQKPAEGSIGGEKQYGLVKSSRYGQQQQSGQRSHDPTHLGPKVELLAQRSEAEATAERERIARINKARGSQRGHLDEAERERRLQEMMKDAEVNDEIRSHRHRPSSRATSAGTAGETRVGGGGDDEDECNASSGVSKGAFLRDMRSQVYKSETEGGTSMEETLSRSRHYHQKGSDLDSHGFMQR